MIFLRAYLVTWATEPVSPHFQSVCEMQVVKTYEMTRWLCAALAQKIESEALSASHSILNLKMNEFRVPKPGASFSSASFSGFIY